MPRKAFIADLQEATRDFTRVNVSGIKAGEDDGQVSFQYEHDGLSTEIIALIPGMLSKQPWILRHLSSIDQLKN